MNYITYDWGYSIKNIPTKIGMLIEGPLLTVFPMNFKKRTEMFDFEVYL